MQTVRRSPLMSGITAVGVAAMALTPVSSLVPQASLPAHRIVVPTAYVPTTFIEAIDKFAADGSLLLTTGIEGAAYIATHAVQDFGSAAVPFAQAAVDELAAADVAWHGLAATGTTAFHAATVAGTTLTQGLEAAIVTGTNSTRTAVADVLTGGQHAWEVVVNADTLSAAAMWQAYQDLYQGVAHAAAQTASGTLATGGLVLTAVLSTGEKMIQGAEATAKQAAQAFEAAVGAVVHPMVVATNRAALAALTAVNVLGHNVAALAGLEAHYAEMWAQDVVAVFGGHQSAPAMSVASATNTPRTPVAAGPHQSTRIVASPSIAATVTSHTGAQRNSPASTHDAHSPKPGSTHEHHRHAGRRSH